MISVRSERVLRLRKEGMLIEREGVSEVSRKGEY